MNTIPEKTVWVSLTTISERVNTVYTTIVSILNQTYYVTGVTLYISKEPYLIDRGIPEIPLDLLLLMEVESRFQIIYTENLGPYRKLIPSLKAHWREDCLLLTVDDDKEYELTMVANMVARFIEEGEQHIIANRAFLQLTPPLRRACREWTDWNDELHSIIKEAIVDKPTSQRISHALGTQYACIRAISFGEGNDGILYHPNFFTPLVFQWKLIRSLARTHDDFWFKMCALASGHGVICIHPAGQRPAKQIGTTMDSALHFNINIGSYERILLRLTQWFHREGLLEMGLRRMGKLNHSRVD